MPVSITIRDMADAVRAELAARAARNELSLEEFLREALIELARKPEVVSHLASVPT